MTVRVIGIGQPCAGDDGVGLRVTARVRGTADLEVIDVGDATAIVDALDTDRRVIIVDAAVGPLPGRVHQLRPEGLATSPLRPVSSHGFSVAQAIELARALHGATPDLHLVAIEIAGATRGDTALSAPVDGAIDAAVEAILGIARE